MDEENKELLISLFNKIKTDVVNMDTYPVNDSTIYSVKSMISELIAICESLNNSIDVLNKKVDSLRNRVNFHDVDLYGGY